tara:strand:+ start:840 stop:1298 length:459 start_codon:yes stop_codon:yes gene_type:complete
MGWSTYFAFIFAAINTLTVTYFLAIERYPELSVIFPSFPQYVLVITIIGIPLLILVGYVHYKRTLAFRSEVDVVLESNPYQLRNVVNNTINVKLTLKMYEMLLKLSQNQKLTENEIEELTKSHKEIQDLDASRSFANKMDIDFIKKHVSKKN